VNTSHIKIATVFSAPEVTIENFVFPVDNRRSDIKVRDATLF